MKDGLTARAHVVAGYRRDPIGFAAALAEVTPAPVPPCAALALHAFEVLSATRGVGMSGPRAITLPDVGSVTTVLGLDLTPRDARWVLEMDAAFCSAVAG